MMHLARSLLQGAMNVGACNEVTEFTADQADHKRITVTHSWLEGSRKKSSIKPSSSHGSGAVDCAYHRQTRERKKRRRMENER